MRKTICMNVKIILVICLRLKSHVAQLGPQQYMAGR